MPHISISFLENADLQNAARVLSIAMLDNPLHVAVYRNADESSRMDIQKDFSMLFMERPGIIFVAREKGRIIGVMRMISCSGKTVGEEKSGPADENDLDWRKTVWHSDWARRDPQAPHWHLGPIGVLPENRGAGVGSLLMERFCAEVDACRAEAYLETDKQANVRFYTRFGFRPHSESLIFGAQNWYMVRSSVSHRTP